MSSLRIAIVDDLALSRAVLRRVLERVPGYTVAWEARDGAEAVAKAAADTPDVILMDLVMPTVGGAEATRRIMAATPCPILIVTSSISTNLPRVYEALGAGGLDAIQTPTLGPDGTVRGEAPLLARLASFANTTSPVVTAAPTRFAPVTPNPSQPFVIAIGASTGGPAAVARVLRDLGPNVPAALVVVQHIGSDFTHGLATWLTSQVLLPVRVCEDGAQLVRGTVHVAGGEQHLILDRSGRFRYTPEPTSYHYRPSIDHFFESLLQSGISRGVAALLTGMGSDGARGLRLLRENGWHTIAQDETSSVVYGMPKAAAQLNAAAEILPIENIGRVIRERVENAARQ